MYRKILVPLDRSEVAEAVLPQVQALATPLETDLILLHVIPPIKRGMDVGVRVISAMELEEAEAGKAQSYLRIVAERLKGQGGLQARAVVKINKDVAEAIVECAREEGVDLTAMYTHNRSRLGRLLGKSIAEKVQQAAPAEVRVFLAKELVAAS